MTFKLSNPDIVRIFRSPFAPAPEFEPLCSQFDGSDNFLVNCSQSTFCMTRTYRLQLRQGEGWREILSPHDDDDDILQAAQMW